MEEYRKESLEASEDEEVIGLYDRELHLRMLHASEIENAKEQGIAQGISKNTVEIAKNLLENGVSEELILKSTGLSKEEFNKLKKDI